MSQPNPIGAIGQLLMGSQTNPANHLGWHTFSVKRPEDAKAGRWCIDMISGEWTFVAEYHSITFYIKDDSDAMLFKLAWRDHFKT
jgi:hypothetical protein